MDNSTILVNKIFWERVNLVIDLPDNSDAGISFLLRNRKTGALVRLKNIKSYLTQNNIMINVSTAFPNCREIAKGKWEVIAQKDGKTFNIVFAQPTEPLMRNFSYKDGSQYIITPLTDENGFLYIEADFIKGHVNYDPISPFMKVFNFVANLIIKATFIASRIFNIHNGKHILFTSDSRAELSGNLELVYKRMVERGLDKQFKIKMCFKENIAVSRSIADSFRLPWLLGWADTIFIDDNHPTLYKVPFSKKVKIVQLWHACGAFKTVGYSRMGKPGGLFITSVTHRIYTHATVSSSYIAPFYAEAFGVDTSVILPTGIPRTDVFFDEKYKSDTKNRIETELPIIKGKKVILFAPTFRGNGPSTAYYPTEAVDFNKLAQLCYDTDSVVIFKLHFLCKNRLEIPQKYKDIMIDCTDTREINDLLFVTDILITDYSSVIYEASTLSIPMLFYAFDLDDYISSRDFYEPYKQFVPGEIIKTFDELIDRIQNNDSNLQKIEDFANRNFQFKDGKSTDRVIDWILLDKR